MQRLDTLVSLLRNQDNETVLQLAATLGVSQRTLMRDLSLLREKGYPIESDTGRGGGVRLNRHYGIGRLMLSYKEAVDLLLSITVMERLGSPILMRNLKSIRSKLSSSFPEHYRQKLQRLRSRVLVSDKASTAVLTSYPEEFKSPVENLIHEAFFEMKVLDIQYQDGTGKKTRRSIEIHYLFLNWPVWYAFAWDKLREAPRHFRIDRIRKAKITNETFQLKKADIFLQDIDHLAERI